MVIRKLYQIFQQFYHKGVIMHVKTIRDKITVEDIPDDLIEPLLEEIQSTIEFYYRFNKQK